MNFITKLTVITGFLIFLYPCPFSFDFFGGNGGGTPDASGLLFNGGNLLRGFGTGLFLFSSGGPTVPSLLTSELISEDSLTRLTGRLGGGLDGGGGKTFFAPGKETVLSVGNVVLETEDEWQFSCFGPGILILLKEDWSGISLGTSDVDKLEFSGPKGSKPCAVSSCESSMHSVFGVLLE